MMADELAEFKAIYLEKTYSKTHLSTLFVG